MQPKFDLVCFDLDGTLIEEENGDVLWERISRIVHGTTDVSKRRYADYIKGKLLLDKWANLDISEWKAAGITKEVLLKETKHSRLTPGTRETLRILKKKGCKLAVISGSVDILLDFVFPDHPFDDVFINKVFFDKKGNISHWTLNPYHSDKCKALKMIAKREKIPLSRTVFVGDHLNDISAANIAGLSIAFNSKRKELKDICDVVIDKKDLREIVRHIT